MNAPRDPLARALDALPPPPPPPPLARVVAAVDLVARQRARRWATTGIAAGLAVVVGAGVLAVGGGREGREGREGTIAAAVVGEALTPDTLVVRRGAGGAPAATALRSGDDVEARDAGRVRLDARVTLTLDPGARVTLTSADEVAQAAGRVRYDVGAHAPQVAPGAARAFTVIAAGVRIVDVGTRFLVDVGPTDGAGDPAARVLVTVEEGEVAVGGAAAGAGGPAAAGRALRAGRGLAFVSGQPVGDDWPTDARPVLTLDVETANPRVGEPVVCRVTLRNPTDAWMPLPTPDDGALLVVEIVGADGVARPVRVTDAMRLPPRPASAVPPRGTTVVRVQFQRTFASPGAYRLRAVYRPADAVEPPRSPEALLTVR